MELKNEYIVGTVITLSDDLKLKVEEDRGPEVCHGCFFNVPEPFGCRRDLRLESVVGFCSRLRRTDRKNVIFKKVETKEE